MKIKEAGPVTIIARSAHGAVSRIEFDILYKDVTQSGDFWYYPTILMTDKGVVKGYDKQTLFKPANNCTRAQMVTFLWRLAGCPEPADSTCVFKDIKSSDYFYKSCIWGNENGIVEGYAVKNSNRDKTFWPAGDCLRRQMVTFLDRYNEKMTPVESYI